MDSNGEELPTIIPLVITLSAASGDGTHWIGYDERTGQQVWTNDCQLCAASSIRAACPTFGHHGWGSTQSAVNSSWALLITPFAYNSSSSSRSHTDANSDSGAGEAPVFDTVKVDLLLQSAISALQWANREPEASGQYELIDDSVLIAEATGMDGAITWRALSASSLEHLNIGELPSGVDSVEGGPHLFLSVDQHSATIMLALHQDLNVHNPVSAIAVRVDKVDVGEAEVSACWRQAASIEYTSSQRQQHRGPTPHAD